MLNGEKIIKAKACIDSLANGIDPFTGTPLSDETILNNAELTRCFFNISILVNDLLLSNSKAANAYKIPFEISSDELSRYRSTEEPVSLSIVVQRINDLTDLTFKKKLSFRTVHGWEIDSGLLEEKTYNGCSYWVPTEQGISLGISTELRKYDDREILVTVYNRDAQQFIVDNLLAILASVAAA